MSCCEFLLNAAAGMGDVRAAIAGAMEKRLIVIIHLDRAARVTGLRA
jgi:hypothetical protein